MLKFNVAISCKLWNKWVRHNPQFIQENDAETLEVLLASVLTSELLKSQRAPLTDTSTSLMLAIGHVKVEETK